MTIAEAKQLRIVDYLASLGYHPQSVISKQYWYLLEKPRDFDPFGHAGFAHLWLQYD